MSSYNRSYSTACCQISQHDQHPQCAGYNDVLDDAKMGWSRYIHSMRVFVFNSGLFYIRPTLASLDLLDRIAYRLDHEDGWDQAIFNEVGDTGYA